MNIITYRQIESSSSYNCDTACSCLRDGLMLMPALGRNAI